MKHDIEIPNFPEGWEPVAYRVPVEGEYFLSVDNKISHANNGHWCPWLIISKKQPRRIVLEETEKTNKFNSSTGEYRTQMISSGEFSLTMCNQRKVWKIVEDNKCAE